MKIVKKTISLIISLLFLLTTAVFSVAAAGGKGYDGGAAPQQKRMREVPYA